MPVALSVMCTKKLHHIDKEDHEDLMKLANLLVRNAVTKSACEEYHTKSETICIHSNIKSWIDIWHKMCFNFGSAFGGFFLPGVNLAETGQAGMMHQQNQTSGIG